jgi:hypothetical protein
MGAPNVVRGGSQAGNASALDMIAEGTCDAPVSVIMIASAPVNGPGPKARTRISVQISASGP